MSKGLFFEEKKIFIHLQRKLNVKIDNVIDLSHFKLFFRGSILTGDDMSVNDLGLKKLDTLHLQASLLGGGFPGLSQLWNKNSKTNIRNAIYSKSFNFIHLFSIFHFFFSVNTITFPT